MNITTILGQLTELKCQIDFCERGIVLSQPTNPSSRYDFIAEINNKLYRIQCKTAHPESNDRISITTQSKNWNTKVRHNYLGEIDYFYTNWNNQGYLLPINLCSEKTRQKTLRLGKPEQYTNYNCNSVLYAKDYKIEKILKDLGINQEPILIESSERREPRVENFCAKCGKVISKEASLSRDCFKETHFSEEKPSREELKNLIRTTPFTKIGEKYGKTDNAIRKWCDSYSLPRRKSDIEKISDKDWEII